MTPPLPSLTAQELDRLEELAGKATRNAWDSWGFDGHGLPSSWSPAGAGHMGLIPKATHQQAYLIAALSPDVVLRLIAAARRETGLDEAARAWGAAKDAMDASTDLTSWSDAESEVVVAEQALRAALREAP